MDLKSELDHVSHYRESEEDNYNARAVFSEVNVGFEVRSYDEKEVYEWRADFDFYDIIDTVEPLHPFTVDPAVMKVDEDGVLRASGFNGSLSNDIVDDPARKWREGYDWEEHRKLQLDVGDGNVFLEKRPGSKNRITVHSVREGSDLFENLFTESINSEKAAKLVEDAKKHFDRM